MHVINKNPLVSVIINCYNGEHFVRSSIESVLNQTFQDWELIFWDNCSTDRSAEIFNSYSDQRFLYFKSKKHTNLGEARNLALKYASGKLVAFLDVDDLWEREKLERQVNIFLSHDFNLGFVYSDVLFFRESIDSNVDGYTAKQLYGFKKLPSGTIWDSLCVDCFIVFSSVLFNKAILIFCGGIDIRYKQSEDYDALLRIAFKFPVGADESVLCHYRIHNSNTTWGQQHLTFIETIEIVNNFSNFTDIHRPLDYWTSLFALWSLSVWDLRYMNLWVRHLLTLRFLQVIYRTMMRKWRIKKWRLKNRNLHCLYLGLKF